MAMVNADLYSYLLAGL